MVDGRGHDRSHFCLLQTELDQLQFEAVHKLLLDFWLCRFYCLDDLVTLIVTSQLIVENNSLNNYRAAKNRNAGIFIYLFYCL